MELTVKLLVVLHIFVLGLNLSYGGLRKYEKRLEEVEKDIKLIENYVYGENRLRQYLHRLSGDIKADFENDMKKTKSLVQSMKDDVKLSINDIGTTLKEVDTSAKSRNVVIAGVLYYGGIGSRCSIGNGDCQLADCECRDRMCQCRPGLSYDSVEQKCVESCSTYGDTYQTLPRRIIRDFNNATQENSTLKECKQRCEQEQGFMCRSFDFFPRWHTCYLSDVTKLGAPEDKWEYNSAGIHFQRDCKHETQKQDIILIT